MDVQSVSGSAPQPTETGSLVDTAAPTAAQNTAPSNANQNQQQPSAKPAHPAAVSTLKEPIQQLYGGGSDVEVTFRVEHDPNMVVTVFRDATTGQEIAQFPPEVMIQLAQFFQKLAGAVVDRSA